MANQESKGERHIKVDPTSPETIADGLLEYVSPVQPDEQVRILEQISRKSDQLGRTDVAIGALEARGTVQARQEAQASVTLEGWGTFYKLPSGGWRGPGGNYGPSTELGRQLEAELSKKSSE